MAYTEIKEKNGRKYFYRVKSVRDGNKVKKKRVYLGIDLKKDKLKESEEKADRELELLATLLNESEIKELDKIKKEHSKQPKSTEDNRYEAFVSLFTYNSTNIEGNTLTLQETSQLLFEGRTPRKSMREINEVLNHKKAFDFILHTKKDISRDFILKLHELVVRDTLKEEPEGQTGRYRKVQVFIRGVDWLPPKPEEVSKEMGSLLSWYSKNKNKVHPLVLVAYFHSAFETVHPFVDGNGRVGRLLMNFTLRRSGFPMINVPNDKKFIYYHSLEEAQVKGNLRPLVKFLFDLLKNEKVKF